MTPTGSETLKIYLLQTFDPYGVRKSYLNKSVKNKSIKFQNPIVYELILGICY